MEHSNNQQSIYRVVTQAKLADGFAKAQVIQALATIFKLDDAKAGKLLSSKQVIKKNIDLAKAQLLQNKLKAIGLLVAIEEDVRPVETSRPSLDGLSLVPTEAEAAAEASAEGPKHATPATITCPKCQLEQPQAEQCTGCGVYLHKVMSEPETGPSPRVQPDRTARQTSRVDAETDAEDAFEDERLTIKIIAAAAGAAMVGAFIWYFIAVTFDYELALVAWIIGGMVGFAAALTRSRGVKAGALCGLLALLAIFGGKYMAMDSIKTDLLGVFQASLQEGDMEAIFAAEIQAAQAYNTDVTNEASLRRFMVDYQYTEAATPEGVEAWELEDFNTYVAPELNSLASGELTAEEYYGYDFQQEMADISTGQLVMESLGIIDLLFVFLGVGTAFRLGRAE